MRVAFGVAALKDKAEMWIPVEVPIVREVLWLRQKRFVVTSQREPDAVSLPRSHFRTQKPSGV